MVRHRYLFAVSAILFIALAARCATAVWWHDRLQRQGQHFAFGDSESYWQLAIQIARGEPYEYGGAEGKIFRVPIYPLIIAPWIDVNDPYRHVLAVRIAGCVFGTLAVAGVMLLANQIFGAPASLYAGGLAAFYPGAISMSILVLSEAPFCPLMIANLLLWRGAYRAQAQFRSGGLGLAAGAIAGVAVLTRPSWLLFAPFACLFQAMFGQYRKTAFMLAAMMLGFAIVMSPWWVRNYRITGHFVLTTLQVGASMYDGLHPGATGASDTGMNFVGQFAQQQRRADAQSEHPSSTFEYRLNSRMAKEAKSWVFANPIQFARLAIVKIGRTWRPWPTADQAQGRLIAITTAVGMMVVVIPAAIGLWRYRERKWEVLFLVMPAIYFTCLHAVFIGSMRYRLPAVLVLTIVAAPVWASWLSRSDEGT